MASPQRATVRDQRSEVREREAQSRTPSGLGLDEAFRQHGIALCLSLVARRRQRSAAEESSVPLSVQCEARHPAVGRLQRKGGSVRAEMVGLPAAVQGLIAWATSRGEQAAVPPLFKGFTRKPRRCAAQRRGSGEATDSSEASSKARRISQAAAMSAARPCCRSQAQASAPMKTSL